MTYLKYVGRDNIGGEEKEGGPVVLGVADDVLQRVRQWSVHDVTDAVGKAGILKGFLTDYGAVATGQLREPIIPFSRRVVFKSG